ncbi:hypothetical protein L596_001055 [Steinernema carpocapsae]|uniref:Uncharacterized protein n=1 Tax=Steinernema carpocapsae TaxID=34508 RepID=A0A4U8UKG4_STECR|nr:hypothetical protein L596_001055 [Steinernema carpocapsae]
MKRFNEQIFNGLVEQIYLHRDRSLIFRISSLPLARGPVGFKHNRSLIRTETRMGDCRGAPERAPGRVNHFACAGATDRSGLVHVLGRD